MALAAASGVAGLHGVAMAGLATGHFVHLNFEDGLALVEPARRLLRAAGWGRLLTLFNANTIYMHFACGQVEQAADVYNTWQTEDGPVDVKAPLQYIPAALGHLARGEVDTAEEVLAWRHQRGQVDRHEDGAWHWAMALTHGAQGRWEQAAALCDAAIASRPEGGEHSPFNRLRFHEVLLQAARHLGDMPRALRAMEGAQAVRMPMLGQNLRLRYLLLQIQHEQALPDVSSPLHRRHLMALERAVAAFSTDASQHLSMLLELPEPPPRPQPAGDPPAARPQAPPRIVAHVSHEMRSPINGLLGLTSLLLLSDLDDRQRRLVSLTQRSAEGLLRLVNDIVDLSRIAHGHFTLAPQLFSPQTLTLDVAALFRPLAEEKGLSLQACLEEGVPEQVWADGPRLGQVLNNLVSNAVKFTRRGSIELRLQARAGETGHCTLRWEVRDTGPGIPGELRSRLFREFGQGDPQQADGSGLGLCICRELLNLMRGRIGLEGGSTTGSLFWIEVAVPTAQPHADPAPSQPRTATG